MRGGFPGMRGGLGSGSTMDYGGGFGGFDGGFGGGRGVVSSYATKTGRKPIGPYMPTGVVNGNLPMDMYEDVLIPVLEAFGTLREVRLKMDPASGLGRGFCFVVYTNGEEARTCVKALKNYQIA